MVVKHVIQINNGITIKNWNVDVSVKSIPHAKMIIVGILANVSVRLVGI